MNETPKETLAAVERILATMTAPVGNWANPSPSMSLCLQHAWLVGVDAGRIEACKPKDNPYSLPQWRWAWMHGFDIGRRLDAMYDALRFVWEAWRNHAQIDDPEWEGYQVMLAVREAIGVVSPKALTNPEPSHA